MYSRLGLAARRRLVRIHGWLERTRRTFDLYCLYGGQAAVDAAASRRETVRTGTILCAVNDNNTIRSVPVGSGARARDMLSPSGDTGPAMAWVDAPGQLDTVDRLSSSAGWLIVTDGSVSEFAVMSRAMFHLSFPPPGDVDLDNCANNGLARDTRLVVDGIPGDDPDGGLNLRSDPGLDAGVYATVPNGTRLSLFLSCEVATDGYRWWAVEYEGAVVWGASEFLRPS